MPPLLVTAPATHRRRGRRSPARAAACTTASRALLAASEPLRSSPSRHPLLPTSGQPSRTSPSRADLPASKRDRRHPKRMIESSAAPSPDPDDGLARAVQVKTGDSHQVSLAAHHLSDLDKYVVVGGAEVRPDRLMLDEGKRVIEPDESWVAAPGPVFGQLAQTGTHRIAGDVAHRRQHVPVGE